MDRIDQPISGYYTTRFVRGGPRVAAKIWQEERGLKAECDGKPIDPYALWPRVMGRGITEIEYRHMTELAMWCRTYAPHEPPANPNQPIDLGAQDPIF